MKSFIRTICLLLCMALLAGMAAACTTPTDTPEPPAPDENETPSEELMDIATADGTRYVVIRNDFLGVNDKETLAARALREAIMAATGAEPGITTDWDERDPSVPELVVGTTARELSSQLPADLGEDEFIILCSGEDILLAGTTPLGTQRAVEYFLTTYLGYNPEDGSYSKTALSVPKDLNYRGSFELPMPVYVISGIKAVKSGNSEDYNDVVRFYTCMQGRLNKTAAENGFWVYQDYDQRDEFWLDYITGDGKLLEGCEPTEIKTWSQLWETFSSYILEMGIVLWDPDVPATSNVASTVCSVEGYLPVRYDTDPNSLYTFLTTNGVEVKLDLCGMFTGEKGTKIADTDIDSTGSIKCDPYLWALEVYGDRVNPAMVAYTLDGASQVESNIIYQRSAVGTDPSANQLYSHDYYIYNECFFVDLTCKDDEAPCDDLTQDIGTDARTLATILSAMQARNNGKFGKLMGFPPWYMKYTVFNDWGTSGEVALEWAFVAFITQYDFIKEADAWNPSWMTNASVYCQYEMTTEKFTNNTSPMEEVFDDKVRYFTMYVGDYDSSAWLKLETPRLFTDARLGDMPMMWAFNPNLSDRVPMIFDYVYENATENDYFVTGDSGAGYVFPSRLEDLDKWVAYNEPYLDRFDMDIVGFIIDDKALSRKTMIAYAEIAPVGSFTNNIKNYITVLDDETVYMYLWGSIQSPHNTDDTRQSIYDLFRNNNSNFAAYRTIRQGTSEMMAFVESLIDFFEAKNDGYEYKYVDMYTLFDLILQSGQGKHIYSE